jgi:hypothetical protein
MNRPDPSGRQPFACESQRTCGVLHTVLISYGAILQLPGI